MSDTRCARSGLQLDVDLMILDYLLYQAIQGLFNYLSGDLEDQGKAHEAGLHHMNLVGFMQLFQHNHPSHKQDAEFNFRLDILEFLVFLFDRVSTVLKFSDATREKFGSQTAANLHVRRTWRAAHERHIRRLGKQPALSESDLDRDVEQKICSVWSRQESPPPPMLPTSPDYPQQPLLFDFLERFMRISANAMDVMEQDISPMWMEFACEFMLQASLESLQLRLQHSNGDGGAESLPRLEDCFAWGYIDLDILTDDDYSALVDAKVDLINNLFRAADNNAEDNAASEEYENPAWTQLRTQSLFEFSISLDAATEHSQGCRLERLALKYPMGPFLRKLILVLQDVWVNICRDGAIGKPVLVEIEEGHLKSLDIEGAAFDDFMATVGLVERDVNGCLKLDL